MIYDFMVLLLTPFGISPLNFIDLCSAISSTESWFHLLSPDVIISFMFYVAFAFGMFYFVFVLPFRVIKRILRAPDKKGRKNG